MPSRPSLDLPLVGHGEALRELASAMQGERMHHGWLLYGPEGIGKAKLAHQASAFLVADKARRGEGLSVDLDHPDARLVAQGAHPDAFWLDKTTGSDGKRTPKTIPVGMVRSTLQKLQSTPAYGGWRAMVIDAVDDLNLDGANALLKPLEEPPRDTVLFLIAHSLSAVLPTIRSRCRHLALGPLGNEDMQGVAGTLAPEADAQRIGLSIALANGRPGQMVDLIAPTSCLDAYADFCALAAEAASPSTGKGEIAKRLKFAGSFSGMAEKDRADLLGLIEDWLSRRVRGLNEPDPLPTPDQALSLQGQQALANLWSEHTSALSVRRAINLDVSETMMALFAALDQVYTQS
jgi:DNA polymerase-3 subunit delta'